MQGFARLTDPGTLQVWDDVEGTEIPALRRFIHANTMARRKVLVRRQVRGKGGGEGGGGRGRYGSVMR